MSKIKPGLVVQSANASPSLAGTNADGMTVTLTEFAVKAGLDATNSPRTQLEVDVDGLTVVAEDSANQSMTFTNVRPSSILRICILRKSRLGRIRDRVLGEYDGIVVELLSEGICTVMKSLHSQSSNRTETGSTGKTVKLVPVNSKASPVELFFRIVIDDSLPTSLDELGLEAATVSLANTRLTLARREAGKFISTVSDTVDTTISIGTQAQAVAEGARKLDSEQVIGVLVAMLDAVVRVGDELSAAHPMIKVAWTVVTCLYKASKAQRELDEDTRQLSEEISVMLAYVAACKDLAPVEGRGNMVLRAVELTQAGACLIDTCMSHRFEVRVVVAPFTNMKARIEDCRRKDGRKENASARQEAMLLQLPFARDATWDRSRAYPGKASIFWLTAPPGAGKTAFAHTAALNASSSREIVLLSFFFERAVSDRNNPRAFVGTLIHLLSGLNPQFKASLCSTLDEKRELPSASSIRQFDELLIHHAATFANQRMLLIIDALDECSESSDDLMAILRDQIPVLPPSFHVFITSRPEKTLLRRLQQLRNVRHHKFELEDDDNLSDIATYIRQRFDTIAIDHGLEESWPGEERRYLFVEKASGLFAWASVALDYIGRVKLFGRDVKLQEVLSQSSTRVTPVQERMDELYMTVLGTCDWDDKEFVQGYQLVVGTVVASRQPLSKSSLEHLLGDTAGVVAEVLNILSPLFTEWETDDVPIQLLHLTLYDFLTHRQRSNGYFIDGVEHSRRIGLQCLVVLTETFKDGVSGLGYSSFWDEYIFRPLPVVDIPESIAYACSFWIEHICLVQPPMEKQYIDALEAFTPCVISWVELVSLRNVFPALTKLREWVMVYAFV
ncbi:uncharacterized protein STEHIDRAFT_114701 [Stereum hirsutum FP-91666 SS1]|uniref:uncharacterized protein n=1 Tax=Stereum hirsutum (strain FP-91666) TaxID=721885 RepID=UPI0004449A3A|nr:uncharacterized protein STEHIDRAFT_114701 [Stereum hirsutum FP-91666 SS1]EIM82043.1 hypothetical protein STEHIDRAFT_114701 [Stereum hirsutum FP-91666 SS1]